jgi:microcystin-dependent protein
MSQPYIGEIRIFAGNFAPNGWLFCQGQTLSIAENDTLFQLIGTTYGGDGQSTFCLPDLQGRVPLHSGQGSGLSQNYIQGETGGVEEVTLTVQQMPTHSHGLQAETGGGTSANAAGKVPAASPSVQLYTQDVGSVALNPAAVGPAGGSQPHDNHMPYLAVNYIISLFGVFPSQT